MFACDECVDAGASVVSGLPRPAVDASERSIEREREVRMRDSRPGRTTR